MGYVDTEAPAAPAQQQPVWLDAAEALRIRRLLAARPPLVSLEDVCALRARLARVAAGEAFVMQAGDCAEDPADCDDERVLRKAATINECAAALAAVGGAQVLRIGRIAGQFAKPRSRPVERVDGVELPVYRGHMVNGPYADPRSRFPDPRRILTGYLAASRMMGVLGWSGATGRVGRRAAADGEPVVWTSHEALLLDYELPMLRGARGGPRWLASTHFPWIGDRTRQPDGAHVALLAAAANPVGCKVGPGTGPEELAAVCRRLDPQREPGRLTLIARMGAEQVGDLLPPLVRRVREAGHPAIWLCDPMHGNTISTADGRKTRLLTAIGQEVSAFRLAVTRSGGVAGGLHLEITPDDTTECVRDESELERVSDRYASLCDPRLNPDQARTVIEAWAAAP
ncbi:3-deoxy-7-phosphoheptulonate synthase [Streptomyces sediminimaris]|uniref:3-deoxy-7-phosphoheptulonate synthase n=1 Tax=Streptomyces sediminimaris TaxID=3383721 RepID=UPI00399A0CDC